MRRQMNTADRSVMARIDQLAALHPHGRVVTRVFVTIKNVRVPVTISRSIRGQQKFFAWGLLKGKMLLEWDETASGVYWKVADNMRAREYGRRCKTCDKIIEHFIPEEISGEFFCSLLCHQIDIQPPQVESDDYERLEDWTVQRIVIILEKYPDGVTKSDLFRLKVRAEIVNAALHRLKRSRQIEELVEPGRSKPTRWYRLLKVEQLLKEGDENAKP